MLTARTATIDGERTTQDCFVVRWQHSHVVVPGRPLYNPRPYSRVQMRELHLSCRHDARQSASHTS